MANEKLKKILKDTWKIWLCFVGILICCFYIFQTCNKKYPTFEEYKKDQITTTKHSIDSTDKVLAGQEQRSRIDTVFIHVHHTKVVEVYKEVIKESPDTCHAYINKLYAISNEQDSLFGAHILRQDSIINGQYFEIQKYKFVNKALEDSIPKFGKAEFKRGKKVGRKQMLIAGAAVTILVETANVVSKVKP